MSTSTIIAVGAVALLLFALFRGRSGSHGIDVDTATAEDIPRLLMSGDKIDAIKVYRRVHGVDLKEAKEAVERLAATLPPRGDRDGSVNEG